mmetsp:Transcript_4852/g.12793  ORF Transcript_4852/g.12793 Transcript_4852/m.12793 type:complete len:237 (-) Transcript_4852:79-789(-)
MKPEPITLSTRSTCSSCPCSSCLNSSFGSPKIATPSCWNIGWYDSATPNAALRSTKNRPDSASTSRLVDEWYVPHCCAPKKPPTVLLMPGSSSSNMVPPVPTWLRSSSSIGAITAPVSILRSIGTADASAGSSAQSSATASSHLASRGSSLPFSPYTSSQNSPIVSDSAHANTAAVVLYAPDASFATHSSADSVRSAIWRWPAFALVAATSASRVHDFCLRTLRAGRAPRRVAIAA